MNDSNVTLLGPDGAPINTVPSTFLTNEEAMLMREYAEWMSAQGYQAVLHCGQCGKTMECYVQGDIGVFCSCRALIHKAS